MRKEIFSIRKIKKIAGSVVIGSALFGMGTPVSAASPSTYHYVDEANLTEQEKALLHTEVPPQDEEVYYLIYRKIEQVLPQTGVRENMAFTAAGLLAASSIVLVVSKKKRHKILGALLITASGAATFIPAQVVAVELNQVIRATSNEGVVQIDGYRYVGYLSEKELKQISHPEQVETTVEAPVEAVTPEVPTTAVEKKEETRIETTTEEIPFETITQADTTLEKGKSRILYAGQAGVRTIQTQVTVVNGVETRKVLSSEVTKQPISQIVGIGAKEQPVTPSTPVEQPKVENPKVETQKVEKPTATTRPKDGVLSPVHELPEYHETKGVQGVKEGEKQGQALTQPELPEYHEAKGVQEVKEGEKQGEALVQPELPEYPIVEETTTREVDFSTKEVLDSTKYEDEVVTSEGTKGVQKTTIVKSAETNEVLSTTTEMEKDPVNKIVTKGTKPVAGTVDEVEKVEIPFATKEQEDNTLKRGITKVVQEGENGKKQITKTYKTIRGEKTTEPPTVTEKVIEEPKDKIINKGTKGLEKPTLQWANTEKDVLKKSATASYTLNKPDGVEIKSIKLALKDKDDKVVKEVTVAENNLQATVDNLKYYQGYKLSTTMVYNRGEGEETETLADQTIQLDLKKVEIKDIRRTDLIKYDQETETNESRLKSIPEDKSKYYLKVTSHDQKSTLLAVKNIEEVTVDGKQMYKVTATADNLVGRQKDQTFESEYTHYIEKSVAANGNVYYDFEDLVSAMQKDPAGEYRLGQSMSARNASANGKSYITNEFTGKLLSEDGKRYAITELERPLFNVIKNATIKNINFEDVDIDRKNDDGIATIANTMNGTSVIEDVKITGSVIGRNNVAGVVNYMNEGTRIENVAFIGKLHSTSENGSALGGIADKNYRGIVTRTYVDAILTGNKVRASSLIPFVEYGMIGDYLIGTKGNLTKSVAKGLINVVTPVQTGAFASKTWPYGTVKDNVSYVKVKNAEMLFGSNDIDDGDAHPQIDKLYSVAGYSEGKKSYTKYPNKQIELTKEAADEKVASYNITANTFESEKSLVATLNATVSQNSAYDQIQDYNDEYKLAYKNFEKLQPFYNKEYIVYQANKLDKAHNLNTKEVLSVTPMHDTKFVTNLEEVNKIMIHYADGTKEYLNLSESTEGLSNVKEYTVTDLGVKYTLNIVQKNYDGLVEGIVSKLSPIELQSDVIYKHFNRPGAGRFDAVKNLYLEESFDYVKNNLTELVTKLVQNENHQLNDSLVAQQMMLDKVEKNKAALILGLTYLNRYYGVKFGEVNIKELMLFKPDFYGKNVSVLDRLIEIGSKENNLSGERTFDVFGEVLSKATLSGNLHQFLDYNRKLFTNIDNMNDWFIDATRDKVYIVERASKMEAIKDRKYRAYQNLNNGIHRKMILPLLNVDKAQMFLISNYNTIAFGSAERSGKNINEMKEQLNKIADQQINYLDFWYRLAADNVKNNLVKDVVTPVWEGYNAPGGWPDKYGRYGKPNVYAPVREVFGPTGKWYSDNGGLAGAYAVIYQNPNQLDAVVFVMSNMISEYGVSAYTHETTHVNDRMAYLGGWRHREGTDVEAFAQGMLQSAVPGGMGEYGALGLNMAFERPNDGNQWYNTNPNELTTRSEIDHYMKGYNDTLMLLDYLEGDAVLKQNNTALNNAWFKKMDKEMRGNSKNQYDKVRALSENEKEIVLNSVDDLVDNNFITNRDFNGVYKPDDFATAYVNVRMTAGIYGGNTSEGSPGGLSFKHNTFRLWGYYGYEKGFIGYASNKYKEESKKAGNATLGDDYIIKKLSDNKFSTLEQWKKAYFAEVVQNATTGLHSFELDGKTITSYNELQELFKQAVEKDKATLNKGSVNAKNVIELKAKVFKKLLQATNSFKEEVFTK